MAIGSFSPGTLSVAYPIGGTGRRQGVIYRIFAQYGDSLTGRQFATQALTNILKITYGEAYEYNYYGTSVQNGLITKAFVDRYNFLITGGGLTTAQAMAQIESSGSVNISFVKTENPRFEYPNYFDFRVAPYDITDRYQFTPLGIQNLKFNGCKLTASSINSNSSQTTDGGPVVKLTNVNQNQIVFSNNQVTTARSNTSGLPVRQLTSRDFSAGASPNITSNVIQVSID